MYDYQLRQLPEKKKINEILSTEANLSWVPKFAYMYIYYCMYMAYSIEASYPRCMQKVHICIYTAACMVRSRQSA